MKYQNICKIKSKNIIIFLISLVYEIKVLSENSERLFCGNTSLGMVHLWIHPYMPMVIVVSNGSGQLTPASSSVTIFLSSNS